MHLSRSKRFAIQMREFETYSFGANVGLSHHDLGYTDDEVASMSESEYALMRENLTAAVRDELYEQLIDDMELTADLVENRRSFIKRARQLVELMDGDATESESAAVPEPTLITKPTTAKLIARRS